MSETRAQEYPGGGGGILGKQGRKTRVNMETVWKIHLKWNFQGTMKYLPQGKMWPAANGTRSWSNCCSISLKSELIWPPRLPDLKPLDFYLWSYMIDEIRKKFLLRLVIWSRKSTRSSNQFLLKFCSASSENSAVVSKNTFS